MKRVDLFSVGAGLAAGALLTYYLDARQGARRRALLRDKLVAAGHDAGELAGAKGKRLGDRLRGLIHIPRGPASERQLHDRVRARLGRLVSHPKSVHVEVAGGDVCLRGHVMRHELDELLHGVRQMRGVRAVRSELVCHDRADLPELQGRTTPRRRGEAQAQARASWH